MVTAYSSWWPDTQIFRSTDSGATWTRAWEFTSYPNRSQRYRMDVSAAPWLTFGANPSPPETTPKLGWMTEALAIDPFDSDRMMYGTGATIYGTHDLTAWDAGGTVDIEVMAEGLEETAVLDLVSPPSGAPLLSALGDVDGFRHASLDAVPPAMFPGPRYASSTSIDFAELNPSVLVRAGNGDRAANPSPQPGGVLHRRRRELVPAPGRARRRDRRRHRGRGGGRLPVRLEPRGRAAARHRRLRRRVDAGAGAAGGRRRRVRPRRPGDVLRRRRRPVPRQPRRRRDVHGDGGHRPAGDGERPVQGRTRARGRRLAGRRRERGRGSAYGLWHSTDRGATFARVAGVDEADTIGFGRAAPGQAYPALYASARIGGVRGIFRSDTAGATWVRINDDAHQWGWTGSAITGDPRVYGRVYVGTNGRGIVYGDIAGDPATPTPLAVGDAVRDAVGHARSRRPSRRR